MVRWLLSFGITAGRHASGKRTMSHDSPPRQHAHAPIERTDREHSLKVQGASGQWQTGPGEYPDSRAFNELLENTGNRNSSRQ